MIWDLIAPGETTVALSPAADESRAERGLLYGGAGPADPALELRDYVELPINGRLDGKGQAVFTKTDGMVRVVTGLGSGS